MEIVRSVWTSLRSVSAPLISAAAIAATLPHDCQLAASQTFHICAGWAPPYELIPGLGPFPVCWVWFGLGIVVGAFLIVFVLLVVFVVILVRKFLWPQREIVGQRREDFERLPRAALVQDRLVVNEALVRQEDLRLVNPQRMSEDTRVELLQLLVHGGHDLLVDMAHQRGVGPNDFLRQVIGVPRRVVPSRSPQLA